MTALGAEQSEDVPWPLTTLVGREAELAALVDLLQVQEPAVRLITLTGPGGVGKSRLALCVAEAARDTFDRVAFVPLATVRDPALVLPAIARAFGIVEVAGAPLAHRLAVALGRGKHLLLIDNFEQIIEAGPGIGALLANAPGLYVLVTSRTLLRIQGEYAFPVPPLGLPPSASRSDKELSSRAAGRYGAVALFTQRARAAEPSFRLTDRKAAAVVAICRRLDGCASSGRRHAELRRGGGGAGETGT